MTTSHSLAAQLKHIRERSEQIVTLLYANKASLGGYWAHEGMYVSVDEVLKVHVWDLDPDDLSGQTFKMREERLPVSYLDMADDEILADFAVRELARQRAVLTGQINQQQAIYKAARSAAREATATARTRVVHEERRLKKLEAQRASLKVDGLPPVS